MSMSDDESVDRAIGDDAVTTLSVVVPCYNESRTLRRCIDAVLSIADSDLRLQIIIVDDASQDDSLAIARDLADRFDGIEVLSHDRNRGKGAALRTGFGHATGEIVAVQDADLEYDPRDLLRLIRPILDGDADVSLGSRFIGGRPHRVLHYWHMLGNRFLTTLSNMMTDMNLTDMETCYKVFRREILAKIEIEEDRFGFEPEIVAKIADGRYRVYEMGIAYRGRSYDQGKKIGLRDGFRALYCIVRYNGHRTSPVIAAMIYVIVGGIAAIVNLICFASLRIAGTEIAPAAMVAFGIAAVVNYFLCVATIFRQRSRWSLPLEILAYVAVVLVAGGFDLFVTLTLAAAGLPPLLAKLAATAATLIINFLGRHYVVFRNRRRGPWNDQLT